MSDSGFLHRYFLNNAHKRLHKFFHYFDIYERHLSRFRGKQPVMIEIGVAGGGSLAMWKTYFGEGCKIIGVDVNPDCKKHEADGIEVFIGSQDDPAVIDQIKAKYGVIDIVLDDGSHRMEHMIATFKMLYGYVQPDGVYMVEDAHTCYNEEFGGGYKREGSFMEFAKDRIDDLHAVHAHRAIRVSDITRSTDSVNFYDGVVVFEKRPQGMRQAPRTAPL